MRRLRPRSMTSTSSLLAGPRSVGALERFVGLAVGIAGLLVVGARLAVADCQVDWDEELYFQVAREWARGNWPFVTIFDHKPPLLYVYYLVATFGGASMATLRTLQAIVLLAAFWSAAKACRAPHPFLCGILALTVFSSRELLGTNSEAIYVAFVAWAFAAATRDRYLAFGVFGALACGVKYTAALDVCGCLIAANLAKGGWAGTIRAGVAFATATSVVQGALAMTFWLHGVDLWQSTVLVNLSHSAGDRRFHVPSRIVGIAAVAAGLWLASRWQRRSPVAIRPAACLLPWFALALADAWVTGKPYGHYFGPAVVPGVFVCAHLLHVVVGPRARAILAVATLALAVGAMWRALDVRKRHAAAATRFEAASLPGQFHVHAQWLAAYRRFGVSPQRFMFPLFYESPHFAALSGSGGAKWLEERRVPVVWDDGERVHVYPDGPALLADPRHRGVMPPLR